MKLDDLLKIKERPTGWSKSSYYRLKSTCNRILNNKHANKEVTIDNIEDIIKDINIEITYKNGEPSLNNRTYKTYISEIKRYIKYKLEKY